MKDKIENTNFLKPKPNIISNVTYSGFIVKFEN